jgi:hypothetical protein
MTEEYKPYTHEDAYPMLSEEGVAEVQRLMDRFKADITEAAKNIIEDATTDMYCNVADYVDSDSWHNYRRSIIDQLGRYDKQGYSQYDAKELGRQLLRYHKEEIQSDIIKDLQEQLDREKEAYRKLQDSYRSY